MGYNWNLTLGSHYENLKPMRIIIIKRGALEHFWRIYPDSKPSLESWYSVVRAATWQTPAEMKQVYHNADVVGRRTVFNIAGNKYRLIARVNYRSQRVFVLFLLTHAEYERGLWKS
jgi:mRNA interferase HigB